MLHPANEEGVVESASASSRSSLVNISVFLLLSSVFFCGVKVPESVFAEGSGLWLLYFSSGAPVSHGPTTTRRRMRRRRRLRPCGSGDGRATRAGRFPSPRGGTATVTPDPRLIITV